MLYTMIVTTNLASATHVMRAHVALLAVDTFLTCKPSTDEYTRDLMDGKVYQDRQSLRALVSALYHADQNGWKLCLNEIGVHWIYISFWRHRFGLCRYCAQGLGPHRHTCFFKQ